MKRFYYGANNIHKTACIFVEFASWYIFWMDNIFNFICGYLIPPIPLPKIPKKLSKEDAEYFGDKNGYTNWNDWWGTIDGWFHCQVHLPIFNFCYDKIKTEMIDIDYARAKEVFGTESKSMFEEEKDEI